MQGCRLAAAGRGGPSQPAKLQSYTETSLNSLRKLFNAFLYHTCSIWAVI